MIKLNYLARDNLLHCPRHTKQGGNYRSGLKKLPQSSPHRYLEVYPIFLAGNLPMLFDWVHWMLQIILTKTLLACLLQGEGVNSCRSDERQPAARLFGSAEVSHVAYPVEPSPAYQATMIVLSFARAIAGQSFTAVVDPDIQPCLRLVRFSGFPQ